MTNLNTIENLKNKKKIRTTTVMLIVSCLMIILYTVANFILQYHTSVEVSPTLTTAWFAFWSGEILCLTGIKVSKVIKHTDDN